MDPTCGLGMPRFFRPARSNTPKHEGCQRGSNKCFSVHSPNHRAIASHQTASLRADHSHGCRSLFFISYSSEHGREDCPLRVHTCGPFIPSLFLDKMKNIFCHEHFWRHQRRSMGMTRERKKPSKIVPPTTVKKTCFFRKSFA